MTLCFSEMGLPRLALGMKGSKMSMFVREGSFWMPNANLNVVIGDLTNDVPVLADKIVPMLKLDVTSCSNKIAIVPLSRERHVLHSMIMSMNDSYWESGISSAGKVDTLRQSIKNWPLVSSWCKCRWFEAIGRLFAYSVSHFIPIPSDILPDIILDFLMDMEPSMETRVPLERVLRYLDNMGYEWVRSAYESKHRNLVEELSYADERLGEKLKRDDASDDMAVRWVLFEFCSRARPENASLSLSLSLSFSFSLLPYIYIYIHPMVYPLTHTYTHRFDF